MPTSTITLLIYSRIQESELQSQTCFKHQTWTIQGWMQKIGLIFIFFADKLRKIRESFTAKHVGVINPFTCDPCHQGPLMTSLSIVIAQEVYRLISMMTSKSFPLDYVPTVVGKPCRAIFLELIVHLVNMLFK